MPEPHWRAALVEFIRANAKPPDKFSHQPRLYQLAVKLAGGQPFDDDVLFASAWLHDLGVFVGHRPANPAELASWDHIAYTTKKAPSLLRELGFPAAKIHAVLEVIRTHLPETEPTTVEGTLMRDADLLEQVGAIGILRIVSKVGRDTRFVHFGDALSVLGQNAGSLPSRLRLESARRLAKSRLKVLHAFLAAAEAEGAGL